MAHDHRKPATRIRIGSAPAGQSTPLTAMRLIYIIVNGALIVLGYIAMVKTDLSSPNPFYSSVLPVVDMIYCIYLLLLVFVEAYNHTWR